MRRRTLLISALVLPALAACRTTEIDQTITLRAIVETVDPTAREVLLRGQDGAQSGALVTLLVGRSVPNLDRIRSGDRVTVTYYQALAVRMARPFSEAGPAAAAMTLDRNPGTAPRPGGEVTRTLSGRITITALDLSSNTVSFLGPNGQPRTVVVRNPEAQQLLRTLRVGERVDVVYEEALAIRIEPTR